MLSVDAALPDTARIVEFNPHDLIAIGCIAVAVLLLMLIATRKKTMR